MFRSFVEKERPQLENIARTVRGLCMDTVLKSNSGHIGLPLGASEILTLLYFGVLQHSPEDEHWIARDRFVLSAGHGSALLYTALHLAGYDLSLEDLKNFRQLGSRTPGHPEYGHTSGVECTTGPLGQGIAMSVGMAMAEAHLRSTFPTLPLGHFTYALVGDGCLMEGVAYEAMSLAGHLGLGRLIALYDDNSITIDGTTDITFSENVPERLRSCGWNVLHADGHDFMSLATALDAAHQNAQSGSSSSAAPTLIVCKTIPGKGLSRWQGKPKVHGNPHTDADVREAKTALGLNPEESFAVSTDVRETCRRLVTQRSQSYRQRKEAFPAALKALPENSAREFQQRFAPAQAAAPSFAFRNDQLASARGAGATRSFSGAALQQIFESVPALVGGSADLAGSNNTTLTATTFMKRGEFSGHNIHFGVREHAMAAISNGLALHGGIRSYCATFAVFSDYMRPAIRLAALMKLPTVFILTHDSYAVGEDGPTHQPIEHAAALRAIPGLRVLRPADGLETFAAWQVTMATSDRPTALMLTRQKVDDLDEILVQQRRPARKFEEILEAVRSGAMLVREATPQSQLMSTSAAPQTTPQVTPQVQARRVTLLASGSEVADALRAAEIIERSGTACRVVSVMGPKELLKHPTLLESLAPTNDILVGIEAGSPESFAALVGRQGLVIGIDRFGESAPAEVLKKALGLSPEAIAQTVLARLAALSAP